MRKLPPSPIGTAGTFHFASSRERLMRRLVRNKVLPLLEASLSSLNSPPKLTGGDAQQPFAERDSEIFKTIGEL